MNVFFFGDSICFGQFVSPSKIWINSISQQLDSIDEDEKIRVLNTSISGNTTRMALERMAFDVQNHGIDVILIQFGMNDCNYWDTDRGVPRVSPESFKANLIEIINRARVFGAKKIFLNTNHSTLLLDKFKYADLTYQQSNENYNKIIRKVAEETDVILIDVEKQWLDELSNGKELNTLLLEDKIHLSPEGHQLYSKIVGPYIIEGVKELL